jgi:hypothetical protein
MSYTSHHDDVVVIIEFRRSGALLKSRAGMLFLKVSLAVLECS